MGVNQDPKGKAESDYTKRTEDSLGVDPLQTMCHVFGSSFKDDGSQVMQFFLHAPLEIPHDQGFQRHSPLWQDILFVVEDRATLLSSGHCHKPSLNAGTSCGGMSFSAIKSL